MFSQENTVFVIVNAVNARLKYVVEQVFSAILGLNFVLSTTLPLETNLPYLYYNGTSTQNVNTVYVETLLFEIGIQPHTFQKWQRESENFPFLLFDATVPEMVKDYTLPDIFAGTFFLLAEYEKYLSPQYDAHGRYDESRLPSVQQGLHTVPIIHYWAESLYKALKNKFPALQKKTRVFDYKLTFDLDQPWQYLYKGYAVNIGGLVRDTFKLNFNAVRARALTLTHKQQDPFDVYHDLLTTLPTEKLYFFILLNGKTKFDNRYRATNQGLVELIKNLQQAGATIGIHPSYLASWDSAKFTQEKRAIESILNVPITHSRQHFIRYRLPDTYRMLISAGIMKDYTTTLITTTGYKHGIVIPFNWYDLLNEKATALQLQPTLLMDRTLMRNYGSDFTRLTQLVDNLITQTYQVQGVFCVLFHNQTIGLNGEWQMGHRLFNYTLNRLGLIN